MHVDALLIAIAAAGTAFVLYQILDMRRFQREIRENRKHFHQLVDPIHAYLAVEPKAYDEERFRAFVRERYGEEQAQQYFAMLQTEWDSVRAKDGYV